MKLSAKQTAMFWRLWAAGCRAQGWADLPRAEVENRRKDLLRRAGFASLKDVDARGGFDAVKRELLLLQDNVRAGMETAEDSEARRLRWIIRHELLPCLALYHPAPEAFLAEIMRDKERWGKGDRPAVDITLEDLSNAPKISMVAGLAVESDSPLKQCLMTLSARLDSMRSAAGHDGHTMRTLAGVNCRCRRCREKVSKNSNRRPFPLEIPTPASAPSFTR